MAEASRESVMSVDLAIQRELAYREKVASLWLHSDADLMPLQVPSSNPSSSLIESPWPEPNSNSSSILNLVPSSSNLLLESTPSPMPLPATNEIHGLRLKPFPVQNPYQLPSLNTKSPSMPSYVPSRGSLPRPPYLSSKKRKASTSNIQYLPHRYPQSSHDSHSTYVTIDPLGTFVCKVCEVPCSGAVSLKQHLKGQKHKAKLQQFQLSQKDDKGNGVGKMDQQLHCELCQIWCINEDSLKMHVKGQKHLAKLHEVELGKGTGEEKVNRRPWCDLCQVWCMNEDSFEQHLKGKNHAARLYATQEKRGPKGRF